MSLSRDNTMGQMNFVYQCFFFCPCVQMHNFSIRTERRSAVTNSVNRNYVQTAGEQNCPTLRYRQLNNRLYKNSKKDDYSPTW